MLKKRIISVLLVPLPMVRTRRMVSAKESLPRDWRMKSWQYGHVARAHSLGGVSVADKEDAGVSKSDVHHFYYDLLNYC